jgi:hypothetical protein
MSPVRNHPTAARVDGTRMREPPPAFVWRLDWRALFCTEGIRSGRVRPPLRLQISCFSCPIAESATFGLDFPLDWADTQARCGLPTGRAHGAARVAHRNANERTAARPPRLGASCPAGLPVDAPFERRCRTRRCARALGQAPRSSPQAPAINARKRPFIAGTGPLHLLSRCSETTDSSRTVAKQSAESRQPVDTLPLSTSRTRSPGCAQGQAPFELSPRIGQSRAGAPDPTINSIESKLP